MTKILVDQDVVRTELGFVCEILKKRWGLTFPRPALYLGSEHESKFLEFHSMKDIARAGLVQMMYDDVCNGIYIPDKLMDDDWFQWRGKSRPQRIFGLLHESVHAALAYMNNVFCKEYSARLTKSKKKAGKEKLYVLLAFNEGLAHYIAIRTCITSGDAELRERGFREARDLTSQFKGWASTQNFSLLADLYKCKKYDVNGILYEYFSRNPYMLEFYKYLIGHRFAVAVKPVTQTIGRHIANPPTSVRELIYPEKYLCNLAKAQSQ